MYSQPLTWIIPADAGSTSQVNHSFFDLEDHPRGCGEHHQLTGAYT